ncbi:MAG: ABC transporter substrate-binding protein [Castellaniella sp.]|uniref:ABC transporter substrate-binding protein n=1 Tax=Castellaniella sp. TaxID=1955812 RepID=UPI0012207B2A|nr:ABC transporter substrate-binding protein [Castellaniella sp.]TAN27156.1 MAG: ABC transporter substrate-binding protein [Castellaniella sp.]
MQPRTFTGRASLGQPSDPARRRVLLAGVLGLPALALSGRSALAASATRSASLAMIGEPQTLDPMLTTADLVGTLMQHVYEPLYTFDSHWNIVPMLAASLPTMRDQGHTVEIPLRQGVKFHDGQFMKVGDVIASLKRWLAVSPRGKAVAAQVAGIEAGADRITLKLKSPYAPLLAQLALPTSMAGVMPEHTVAAQLTQFVGTGPYRLKERRPDQYTILEKFDQYAARSEAPDGYGGRRTAYIQELRFVPVPDSNTRTEGILSGQFAYADLLPVEVAGRLERGGKAVVPLIGKDFGFPYLVFNTRKGTLASVPLRQAAQAALGAEEMMAAAFGDPRFFSIGANFFPQGTPYYSLAGQQHYNVNQPKLAADLARKADYAGKPIRILASRQYEFHYNIALVLAEQFKRAGLATDLQVVDWATLLQRRNDPELWDIYITHSGLFPEPMLSPPQLGDGAPGWWDTPEKTRLLAAFNQQVDLALRGPLWGPVQQLVYEQVPFVELGKFNSLSARASRLQGFVPSAWPFFWNTRFA